VAEVVNELGNYERHFGRRKRRRRPYDQKTFEASVVAVVSNLIHRELTERGAKLAVSHSNQVPGCAWPLRGREEVPVAGIRHASRQEAEGHERPVAEGHVGERRAQGHL
jgi:hypothetical protein